VLETGYVILGEPMTITFLPFSCFVIMRIPSAPTWLLRTNEIKFIQFLLYNKQSSLIGKAKHKFTEICEHFFAAFVGYVMESDFN
jgi:hypothetical protein